MGRLRRLFDTLSGRLTLVHAVLVLPPILISLSLAWSSYVERTERARLQVRHFAALTATYQTKFFEDVRRTLREISAEDAIRNKVSYRCDEILDQALGNNREFASIGLFGVDGVRICGDDNGNSDVSSRSWMDEVRRHRGFVISDYTVTPDARSPVIVAAQAVIGEDGDLVGVLAASIRLYWLANFIEGLSLPEQSVFFLFDGNGNVLADRAAVSSARLGGPGLASRPAGVLTALSDVVGQKFSTAALGQRPSDFVAMDANGLKRVFSSVTLPHGDATVLFGMPAARSIGWLDEDLMHSALALVAILLAGLGAAWLGMRYLVTRWTSSLSRTARACGRGEYVHDTNFNHAPRELRELGETLHLMSERIRTREAELRNSLELKDAILKEVHHRVKNNLQIVTSLLSLRSGEVPASQITALDEVRAHVKALALVHRYLYESEEIERVDLGSFMTELCRNVINGLAQPHQQIRLIADIPEFMMTTDRATPIALLVTEAITNSIKHGLAGRECGTITVRLDRDPGGAVRLVVADDGAGFDEPPAASRGLGLELMHAFANQIGGTISIRGHPGTTVEVMLDDVADTRRAREEDERPADPPRERDDAA